MLSLKNILIVCQLISMFVVLNSTAGSSVVDIRQPIRNNKLTIIIHKPINEVFDFTCDPHNTPKWINSIQSEKTNEWPPRIGTIYKNRGSSTPWSVYRVTQYKKDRQFQLEKDDGSTYHVNYDYSTITNGTKLVYQEWVMKGALNDPFTQANLEKLKLVMENGVASLQPSASSSR